MQTKVNMLDQEQCWRMGVDKKAKTLQSFGIDLDDIINKLNDVFAK